MQRISDTAVQPDSLLALVPDSGTQPQQSLDLAPPSSEAIQALDRSLFAGIAWTALARWAAQAISWASMFYVARILTPSDFGLIAMSMIPIGLARLIEDLGLDTIVVQDRTLSEEKVSQLGGAALSLGGAIALLFLGASWPIAEYFREAAVAGIVCALSLTFLTDALQIIPRALLQRDLQFQTLAWLHVVQVAVAAVTVALCAAMGMGYWALVLNTLVSQIIVTIAVLAIRPFRPTWPRQWRPLAQSLIAARQILVSRFAYYGYSRMDVTLIGRFLGKEALGAYDFSMTFASVPMQEVTGMMSKVIPGIFTTVQTHTATLRRYFLLLTEVVSYLTTPMAIGLALTADDFVLLVLGDQWEAVITPLRILSLYMVMNGAQFLLGHVLLWTGRFRMSMYLNLFALFVLPIGFYIGVSWGVAGVAWAWTIAFPVSILPGMIYVAKVLELRMSEMVDTLKPALVSCALMAAAVVSLRWSLPVEWHHGLRLAVQSALGAVVYIGTMCLWFQARTWSIIRIILDSRGGAPIATKGICTESRSD